METSNIKVKFLKHPPKARSAARKKADFEAAVTYIQNALLCPVIAACAAAPQGSVWLLTLEFLGVLAAVTTVDFFFGGFVTKKIRIFLKTGIYLVLYFALMLISAAELINAIYSIVLAVIGTAAIYAANRRCDATSSFSLRSQICARIICAIVVALAISRAVIKL